MECKRSAGTQGVTKPGQEKTFSAKGIQLLSLTDMLESYTRELAVNVKQFASGTITVLNVGCVPTDFKRDDAKGRPYGEQERASHRLRIQVNCAGLATALIPKSAPGNSSFIIHCRMPKTVLFLRHNFCAVCIRNKSNELFRL